MNRLEAVAMVGGQNLSMAALVLMLDAVALLGGLLVLVVLLLCV